MARRAHDDSKAIQEAINDALEVGGGTIYFPVGTYVIGRRQEAVMDTWKVEPLPGASVTLDETGNVIFQHWKLDGDSPLDLSKPEPAALAILDWLRERVLNPSADKGRSTMPIVKNKDYHRALVESLAKAQAEIELLQARLAWLEQNPLSAPCNSKCAWCKTGKSGGCYCGLEQWEAKEPADSRRR